jgi:hypothetical protein
MLAFTVPRPQNPVPAVLPMPSISPRSSIWSPSGVPDPCASTYRRSAPFTPATPSAARTTDATPSWLGAVNPDRAAPSLPTALPRITACTGSPSASASESRRSATTPTPELNDVPVDRVSNARHNPSAEVMPPGRYR